MKCWWTIKAAQQIVKGLRKNRREINVGGGELIILKIKQLSDDLERAALLGFNEASIAHQFITDINEQLKEVA